MAGVVFAATDVHPGAGETGDDGEGAPGDFRFERTFDLFAFGQPLRACLAPEFRRDDEPRETFVPVLFHAVALPEKQPEQMVRGSVAKIRRPARERRRKRVVCFDAFAPKIGERESRHRPGIVSLRRALRQDDDALGPVLGGCEVAVSFGYVLRPVVPDVTG